MVKLENLRMLRHLLILVFHLFNIFDHKLCMTSIYNLTNGVDHEKLLIAKLESSLPKYSPPADLLNKTVFVFVDLYQLSDVNEKDGLITVKLWLYYYYYSESAKWNVEDFGGIRSILVPRHTFWTADIGK